LYLLNIVYLLCFSSIDSRYDMLTKDSRRQWEKEFYKSFIAPVVSEMESNLKEAQRKVITDERQGN